MTALISEAPLGVAVVDCERVECLCGRISPFLDDEDEGHQEAHDAGWHVLGREECECPILCGDCAEEWCGVRDDSPRLLGMRVI
ncbi:hypothetical protein [Streptomyces nanshensis]|uniref:Uncharacterized protein n=1 Tax=Streptomyces nanshensis TaxID=518642 RepID=A0A1E7LCH7_9ACTN|nr:hypothetical protein [Streptomyces nanshensis]OEV13811.1 hypothetical protein AN218_01890 [Streptomyces nanshensis]